MQRNLKQILCFTDQSPVGQFPTQPLQLAPQALLNITAAGHAPGDTPDQ
jgi:hypothetical protein